MKQTLYSAYSDNGVNWYIHDISCLIQQTSYYINENVIEIKNRPQIYAFW